MIRNIPAYVSPTTRQGLRRVLSVVTAAGLTIAGYSGCGDPNAAKLQTVHPVKGKVLLADGTPLKAGSVVLVSTTAPTEYAGSIGPDGTFEVKTAYGEGAPEGTYRVRIDPEMTSSGAKGKSSSRKPGANLPFPAKYTEDTTSGLTVTVKPGENNLEPFTLAPGQAASKSKGEKNTPGERD